MSSDDIARVALAGMNSDRGIDFTAVIIVLSTLLLCVALPVFLHYRTKARVALAAGDQAGVQDLWTAARRMEARIGYLETVLDTEVPGWRSRSEIR